MKADTKNRYYERLSGMNRQVQAWLAQGLEEGEEEALQKLWKRVREVENGLIDGTGLNTITVSNQLASIDVAIDTMRRRLAGEIVEDTPAEPIAEVPTEPTELGSVILDGLARIQGELGEYYTMIIDKHPIASTGMPAVDELRLRAAEIGSTMQKIAKMAGVL